METRLSSKGQITLPSEVRRRLKIRTGDALVVKAVGENNVVLEVQRKALTTSKATAEDIINATAGLWRDRGDIGETFIRDLRESDHRRLEGLFDE